MLSRVFGLPFARPPYPAEWVRPYFAADDRSLSAQAARSSAWLLGGTLAQRIVQIFVTAVLARLLTPADFGLVNGMGAVALALIREFGNYGLGAALIYRQDTSQVHLSTAFWFNLAVSVLLCGLALAVSPAVADYFRNDQVAPVLSVLAVLFVIDGLGSVHAAILTKTLRFRDRATIDLASAIATFVATLFCVLVLNLGFWSLVVGHVAASVTGTSLRVALVRWLPVRLFDLPALGEMLRYGINFFLNGIIHQVQSKVDYIVTGRLLGAANLGIYLFAFAVPETIRTQFSRRLSSVIFPVLCKVNEEKERFARGYLSAVRYISLVTFPASLGVLAVAPYFVRVVYGEQWLAAIVPLRILCLGVLVTSVFTTMGAVFSAKGRPEIEVRWNAFILPVICVAVWIGARWGIVGVAAAMTATAYFGFVPMWLATRLAGIRFPRFLAALAPALLGSVCMAAVLLVVDKVWLARHGVAPWISLLILTALGALVYGAWSLAFQRNTVREMWRFGRSGFGRA